MTSSAASAVAVEDGVLRCAVVDDDPDDRIILRSLLAQGPFKRCEISDIPVGDDPSTTIEALQGGTFDICFLDHFLGAFTGPQLLRMAPQISGEMAVIIFTVAEDLATAEEALAHGALDYLPKNGLDGIALARSMRYAIHLHHSFRHLREQHEHSLRQQRGVLLGSLAGGIAHEFNNINAAILGHAELLAGVAGDDAQARRHLGVITSSISRSSGIINGIRQLAEQSGRGRCSLSEVMTNVLMLHGPRLQRHGVQVDGVEHLPEVRLTIDAGSLTTVLTQIIQNALHAMLGRPGGRLTCAATLDGPWCRLRIGDDGVGMDADQLARATEPFVSYKGPFDRGGVYPREVGGAGLGLAVCRRLLEACDGDLGIVSHPGSGTQVEISIPLASGEDSSYQALPILRPGVDPASLRVVVADDQAVLRRLLAAMIGDLGCQVQSVTALDALVEVCAQQLPDVLVLDWYLGEADGFQVVAALRRCCAVDKLNLVVCSASPPLRREVAELGFASHHILAKPVSRQDLQACLMAIAGGHRTRRS